MIWADRNLEHECYDLTLNQITGEGFKLAIHSHMDQPIMALSDIGGFQLL